MKNLSRTCHNQKHQPAQTSYHETREMISSKEPETEAMTRSRRRLGRFALVAGRAPAVKKIDSIHKATSVVSAHNTPPDFASEDDRLPSMSFISSGSWKADCELLAEMDKVEAAMKCDQSPTRNGLQTNASVRSKSAVTADSSGSHHSTIDTANSSALSTSVGIKRKAARQTFQLVAEGLSSASHDDRLMGVSNPIDKRPKLNLIRASPRILKNKSSFATPEGRYYGSKKCKESSIDFDKEIENDISFSPLLETPNISPKSSDEENAASSKSRRIGPSKKSLHTSSKKNVKTKVTLNLIETPKRSSARKRQSPKNLMTPEVKISKSDGKKNSPRDDCFMRKNEIDETVKDSKLKTTKMSLSIKTKKTFSQRLKSNCTESQKHQLENELQSSSNAPSTSSSVPTTSGQNITLSSVNTSSANISLTEDKRLLKSWGLPDPVLSAYQKYGVTTMFEWQAECLLSPSVLDGGNLIYSAPTSAGKTLVAEILVMKRVLETRKKALFILPFVSVAREKMFTLQRLYQDAGIRVGGYMGSHSPAGGLSALDVAVCTIEKGNGLVNRMMEDGRIDEIGVVVVDELHMVGDSHRGYLLELMLTKLQFLSLRRESDQRLQIIGMSATLPNLEVLAKWLTAALYRTDFRPVPLSEHIKVNNRIFDSELVPQGEVPARFISPDDSDHVLALCLETVISNHSVLVFCPTKNWCEKLCETIARKFYQITHSQRAAAADSACKENDDSQNRLTLNKSGLRESLEQLRRCPVGIDPMLGRCIINGVAYHHAGLTFDERDIIEGAFREGNLRVLVATSTLSSGVNLPARRVIIRTPMFHGQVIDVLTFKQMSGRAGRKGVDTEGESILVCKPSEKMKGRSLLQSELPPVESCLHFDDESGLSRSLKRAILEVVVSGVTSSPEDVMSYIKCTLLSAFMDDSTAMESEGPCTASLIEKCITFLQDSEFVSMQTVKKEDGTECKKFFPTQLGSAILASSLSPDEGLLVFAELQKARRSFVLESELHVIYLVTPVYTTDIATSIDWYHFYTLWENLSPAERRVADLVGIREGFISQAIGGRINKKTEAQRKTVAVHHRFYTSLVLNTLVREVPLMEVAAKFNLNKGQLQSLQQSAATYTGMLTVFCQRLGWHNLELILSRFQRRLSMGVQHELVDLVRISALTASSARMLYNAGYHTVADVARAEAIEVEELFKTAVPFQSDKKQEGETDWERKERQKAKCIWLTGRKGMTELDAAKEIIQEAKGIVQGDLGVKDIAWNSKDCETMAESSSESGDDEEEERCNDKEKENYKTNSIEENRSCKDEENTMANDHETPSTSRSGMRNMRKIEETSHNKHKESVLSGSSLFTGIKSRLSVQKQKSLISYTDTTINNVLKGPGMKSQRLLQGKEEMDEIFNRNLDNKSTQGGKDSDTQTNVSSSSERKTRKTPCSRRRKSAASANRSKRSEASFFGQVVVTPPPGLRLLVDDRNKSKLCGDNSWDLVCDENHTPTDGTQNGHDRNISKQSSQRKEKRCDDQIKNTRSEHVEKSSTCSEQGDIGEDETHISDIGENIHQKSNPLNTEVLPTSGCSQPIESCAAENSDKMTPSLLRTCEVGKNGLKERTELIEPNSEIVCDSKNTSDNYDNLSFSESFILDTQTAALINTNYNEYMTNDQISQVKENICDSESHTKVCCTAGILNASRKELPFSSLTLRRSTRKLCSKPRSKKDVIKKSDENTSLANSLLSDQSAENVSLFDSSVNSNDQDVGQDGTQNVNHDSCTELSGMEVDNQSSSLLKPQREYLEKGNDEDNDQEITDCEDEPDSLLVASCYDRVLNFDEGMLECSGYDELGINNSYSELNILKSTAEADFESKQTSTKTSFGLVQEMKSKPNLNSKSLNNNKTVMASTSWNTFKTSNGFNHLSDTQCTDDSLLAAVDMGSLTPLSSHRGKDVRCVFRDHDTDLQCGDKSKKNVDTHEADTNKSGETCKEKRIEHEDKVLQNSNTNPHYDLPDPSENNVLLSDSLSASIVDQVFAQCDLTSIKTSSPCNTNCSQPKTLTGRILCNQSLTHTTPVSKHALTKTAATHMDISPVLWDNIDSNTNSLNNSSCHDGSDCVPPTPPDATTSHASPFKLAFFSPGTNRKKIGSPSNNRKQTDEPNIRTAAKKLRCHGESLSRNNGMLHRSCTNEEVGMDNNTRLSRFDKGKDSLPNHIGLSSDDNLLSDCLDEPLIDDGNARENVLPPVSNSNDIIISQSQLFTQQSFTIIDVCANKDLFETFLNEWRSQPSFSLALACEKVAVVGKGKTPTGIGSRFNKRKSTHQSFQATDTPSGLPIPNAGVQLVGMAVTWEHRDAYYLSLMDANHKNQDSDPDDSLAEPSLCDSISIQDRINAVITHLHTCSGSKVQIIQIYDTKTVYTTLAKTLGVSLTRCEDPRVADWLQEPGNRLKNLHRMVTTYLPDELALLEEVGGGSCYQSLGFDVKSRVSGRIRACTESILTRKLMVEYGHMLVEQELWQAFERTEMPALLTLSRMELNGFGLSMSELESQKSLMKAKLESIEQTAYKMAGHVFSLTSLDDIAKILYLELKLPLNGDPDAVPHLPARGTRHRRTVGGTSKEILEKLTKFHPLPALILEWRRISSALTKSLFALQRTAQHCDHLDMVRVFGDCQVFSATGRVSMAEPNIQNIPKDFCIELKESEVCGETSTSCSNQHILSQSVSMRKMFVPFAGGVILSADYSQLELRIIAHLSGDSKLSRILNEEGGDVFKLIAAQFKSMDVEEVTATDRQHAKQVCYGMLYGIGPKALGEQIGVCENEATVFMETFKSTYPGIRKYLRETIEFCQKNGYVKTLFNRRRYLPSIKHTNPHARAQAERQAVNTSVQGSAADLVKKAMTNIDLRLMKMFPDCLSTHSQRRVDASVANKTRCGTKAPQGGFFLLQLHDELIYEVNARHTDVVARLVREEMEGACSLCVRMPVKVNVGPSWGQLEEYNFGRK